MRKILDSEDYVAVPPDLYSDPFFRITYLIKEEIRKYKWTQGEQGRTLSWEEAKDEWIAKYQDSYVRFLHETLRVGGEEE